MPELSRLLPLVSAATLALVIGQGAGAETPAATPAPAATPDTNPTPAAPDGAPPAAAPNTPSTPADAARARAEEQRAARLAEREQRYAELRARAAEIGVELPEAPPWASTDWPRMPEPPAMPERGGPSAEEVQAMREQRRAMREQMRSMTPEERRAMRDAHWQQVRADAAERGIEMPETPPWAAAEQRRRELDEEIERYRKTLEAMTDEEIEAARAVFGNTPPMPEPPAMPPRMPYRGYGYGPHAGAGYPGGMPYQPDPEGMGAAPPASYFGPGAEQGPPPPAGSGY